MTMVFFGAYGIVYIELLPQDQAINQYLFKDLLRRLTRSARQKKKEFWDRKNLCHIALLYSAK